MMEVKVLLLVGFIPTTEGWAAVQAAVREAKTSGGQLIVVNSSSGDAPSDRRRAQSDDVTRLREVLEESSVPYELEQTEHHRDAADQILETAHARSVDRIVIGVRRRSAVGKLILGSTAQRVILGADCPVLTVKPTSRNMG